MKLGMHGLFYTTEPEAARAFLRDKMQLASFDSGGGWLIFDLASADLGCHPGDRPFHALSFSCDDIDAAMAELRGRGVELTPVREEEWGRVTSFDLPGGGPIQLYQAKYR